MTWLLGVESSSLVSQNVPCYFNLFNLIQVSHQPVGVQPPILGRSPGSKDMDCQCFVIESKAKLAIMYKLALSLHVTFERKNFKEFLPKWA
jgi:hypothetical protein